MKTGGQASPGRNGSSLDFPASKCIGENVKHFSMVEGMIHNVPAMARRKSIEAEGGVLFFNHTNNSQILIHSISKML